MLVYPSEGGTIDQHDRIERRVAGVRSSGPGIHERLVHAAVGRWHLIGCGPGGRTSAGEHGDACRAADYCPKLDHSY
jgi:hypothetical protein